MAEENPAAQSQTAVAAYFTSKQLLLFVFVRQRWDRKMAEENHEAQRQTAVQRRSVCQYSMAEENPAAQSQTAVAAYFTSKQLLLFVFVRQRWDRKMAEENHEAQRQTAVQRRSVCQYSMAEENHASKQLLLFVFARQRWAQ